MDYDGIREEAHHGFDDLVDYVAEALKETLGARTTRTLITSRAWQVAGYRLAYYLMMRHRLPLQYIQSFSTGFLLALHEHEDKAQGKHWFNEEEVAKVEEKIGKLLRLAGHEGTGENEAHAAIAGFVKILKHGEVAVFSKARMLYWASDYEKVKATMQHVFKHHPWLNLWGASPK